MRPSLEDTILDSKIVESVETTEAPTETVAPIEGTPEIPNAEVIPDAPSTVASEG